MVPRLPPGPAEPGSYFFVYLCILYVKSLMAPHCLKCIYIPPPPCRRLHTTMLAILQLLFLEGTLYITTPGPLHLQTLPPGTLSLHCCRQDSHHPAFRQALSDPPPLCPITFCTVFLAFIMSILSIHRSYTAECRF